MLENYTPQKHPYIQNILRMSEHVPVILAVGRQKHANLRKLEASLVCLSILGQQGLHSEMVSDGEMGGRENTCVYSLTSPPFIPGLGQPPCYFL